MQLHIALLHQNRVHAHCTEHSVQIETSSPLGIPRWLLHCSKNWHKLYLQQINILPLHMCVCAMCIAFYDDVVQQSLHTSSLQYRHPFCLRKCCTSIRATTSYQDSVWANFCPVWHHLNRRCSEKDKNKYFLTLKNIFVQNHGDVLEEDVEGAVPGSEHS